MIKTVSIKDKLIYTCLISLLFIPGFLLAKEKYGSLNKAAPQELKLFSFLVGKHHCRGIKLNKDRTKTKFEATWTGRYSMDGYVIEDEFRIQSKNGEVTRLGTNYRAYNSENKQWQLRWFDALSPSWTNLAKPEDGGVNTDNDEISFMIIDDDVHFKIRFINVTNNSFTWLGELSLDKGENWHLDYERIDCTRVE